MIELVFKSIYKQCPYFKSFLEEITFNICTPISKLLKNECRFPTRLWWKFGVNFASNDFSNEGSANFRNAPTAI